MGDVFLAVDWGTTNRRAFLIEDGAVVSTERDATGILAVPAGGFPAAVAALRARYGPVPAILAGMIPTRFGCLSGGCCAGSPATASSWWPAAGASCRALSPTRPEVKLPSASSTSLRSLLL